MKKVILMEVQQYGQTFYMGKYDPRLLVQMTDQSIEVGTLQEAQRPLDKKHLQEIAEYVAPPQKGLLPASILIATIQRDKLTVEYEQLPNGERVCYMMFPETPEELQRYANTIDTMDGQHRLFSFSPKYRHENLKDDMPYEITFSLFITPDLKTRQLLFTITNEKQKPVGSNLLLYLREKLNMLTSAEKTYYPLVQSLSKENASPLQGRIIMSAEKISKGYKAKELIKIFDKAKFGQFTLNNQPLTLDEQLKAVCTYLEAWEEFYHLSFARPGKETMTKISGLRYLLLLLPTFLEYCVNRQQQYTKDFVKSVIQRLQECKGLVGDQTLFDNSLDFRGEGATVKLAQDDAAALKAYLASHDSNGFNPFA